MRIPTLVAALACLVVACGDTKPEPSTPSSAPTASAAAPPTASASAEPEARKPRKPFEVYSSCGDVVTVSFGEDPKAPNVGKRTIAPSSAIEGARDNDGNQVVWLLDSNGEPLVKVHVTRGMKRVEVGRSCRTLDAR